MAARPPLYRHVKQQITDALRSGKWKHGQKIASEPQLAERFGVSIGTVRKAVGELEAENILVREQGRGTFVVSHTRDYMLNVFFRVVDSDGHKELPTMSLLSMKRGRADGTTAALLHIAPRAPVIDIEALLSLKGRPTILDRIRLPVSLFAELGEHLFKRRDGTLYGLFQERFGITIVRVEENITAVIAGERDSRLLGVANGSPLLRIRRVGYTYKNVPVDARVRLVDSSKHGYLSVLGSGS
ncbi:MAG: GntR family transcriptional regulator [Methylibium sp.]|uniref:GntR family transcriptional regulator n=1 Tax=Methylibium sp. TaxID=2067992 RepID=UPI0017E79048|nr:GntR family transcriptional regulator [Methylibium sp.]MBA3596147.1 GntR family transcriptional regulator [Methylibium sp.]